MISHEIRVYPSAETPSRSGQFAWKIAALAADPVPVEAEVAGMVINRIIDNAAVAMAAINRRPVANARSQALAHPRQGGATVFGLPSSERFEAEWAGWANATAVRELDFHDTFFAAESSPHQVWLFKKFGAGVNLGPNLDTPINRKLEATRRTLSREGDYTTLIDRLKQG